MLRPRFLIVLLTVLALLAPASSAQAIFIAPMNTGFGRPVQLLPGMNCIALTDSGHLINRCTRKEVDAIFWRTSRHICMTEDAEHIRQLADLPIRMYPTRAATAQGRKIYAVSFIDRDDHKLTRRYAPAPKNTPAKCAAMLPAKPAPAAGHKNGSMWLVLLFPLGLLAVAGLAALVARAMPRGRYYA